MTPNFVSLDPNGTLALEFKPISKCLLLVSILVVNRHFEINVSKTDCLYVPSQTYFFTFLSQLIITPLFQLLRPKTLITFTLFLVHVTCKATANTVGSIFKIHPESDCLDSSSRALTLAQATIISHLDCVVSS